MTSYTISVIIPLFKDWDRLMLCLNALENQIHVEGAFEVIVVNNNPSDSRRPDSTFSYPLHFFDQPIPGSYAARNMGLKHASGQAFLFTDSDCIPTENWISEAFKLIENGKSDLFAGKIEVFSPFQNQYVDYEKVFAFSNLYYVTHENFGVTANLLVKREVVDNLGGFNASLLTGGDSEFCNRAVNAGYKIEYSPGLLIKHPARASWAELKVKAIRFGGRLPKARNSAWMVMKLIGKFRIRLRDITQVTNLEEIGMSNKVKFIAIKQRMRWVEAVESFRVYLGKKPGRK